MLREVEGVPFILFSTFLLVFKGLTRDSEDGGGSPEGKKQVASPGNPEDEGQDTEGFKAAAIDAGYQSAGKVNGSDRPISEVSTISLTVKHPADTFRAGSAQSLAPFNSQVGRPTQMTFLRRPISAANHQQYTGEQSFLPSTDGAPRINRRRPNSISSLRSEELHFESGTRDSQDNPLFSTPTGSARMDRKRAQSSSSPTSIDGNLDMTSLIPATPESSLSKYVSSQMSDYRSLEHVNPSLQSPIPDFPVASQAIMYTGGGLVSPSGKLFRPSSHIRSLESLSETTELVNHVSQSESKEQPQEDGIGHMSDISEAESMDIRSPPTQTTSSSKKEGSPVIEEPAQLPSTADVLGQAQHATATGHDHLQEDQLESALGTVYPQDQEEHQAEKEVEEIVEPICDWKDCGEHFLTQVC